MTLSSPCANLFIYFFSSIAPVIFLFFVPNASFCILENIKQEIRLDIRLITLVMKAVKI